MGRRWIKKRENVIVKWRMIRGRRGEKGEWRVKRKSDDKAKME